MTGKELLNIKVSYYNNVNQNFSEKQVKLIDWFSKYYMQYQSKVNQIREYYKLNKQYAKEAKAELLPCITISGVYKKYRRVSDVSVQTPIIAIDIDADDNIEINDWEMIKWKIALLPYVFLTSYSVSGRGLFCLVYYNLDVNFGDMFRALQHDFKEMGINIDKNCKDITRLRFISYDDNILIRMGEVEQYNKELKPNYSTNFKNKGTFKESDEFTYKAIYYLIKVDKYRADEYNDWLLDGFRLSTFGSFGYVLFMLLSQLSKGYDRNKAEEKFWECQRSGRLDKSSLSHYFKLLKDKHGEHWKQIVIDYKES